MAVQSTARRAEAPQEAASAAMAKTAPEAEPIAKAAKPARRPRAVAGSRSTKGESSESAGRPAAGESIARNRPASEAGTTPRTSAASPAVVRPSQKEPEPQVTPENADPPQQVGRPPAQSGRPEAAPAGAPRQASPTAPIVQTRSAARPGAAPAGQPARAAAPQSAATNDLTRDELRAYLSAVEAQVRAALRQVDAQSKEVQQAHTALRADLSAVLIHLAVRQQGRRPATRSQDQPLNCEHGRWFRSEPADASGRHHRLAGTLHLHRCARRRHPVDSITHQLAAGRAA